MEIPSFWQAAAEEAPLVRRVRYSSCCLRVRVLTSSVVGSRQGAFGRTGFPARPRSVLEGGETLSGGSALCLSSPGRGEAEDLRRFGLALAGPAVVEDVVDRRGVAAFEEGFFRDEGLGSMTTTSKDS